MWDRASGQCVQTLDGHSGSVWVYAVAIEGDTIVSGSDDKSVRVGEDLELARCTALTELPDRLNVGGSILLY